MRQRPDYYAEMRHAAKIRAILDEKAVHGFRVAISARSPRIIGESAAEYFERLDVVHITKYVIAKQEMMRGHMDIREFVRLHFDMLIYVHRAKEKFYTSQKDYQNAYPITQRN